MIYDIIIFDKISCKSFVDWTYEENSEMEGREGLLRIHLESATNVAKGEKQLIGISSITKKEIESTYSNDDRATFHVSSLLEVARDFDSFQRMNEEDSIIKLASISTWKKINFCILTGNSLLYDKCKKNGFEVLSINESNKVFDE